MKLTLTVKTEAEVKFLLASCGVRYWEDASVDGVNDEDGSLIPCRVGSRWCPLIELETGIILNWTPGKTADIHYKVCDDGEYSLLDPDKNIVLQINRYVPGIMSPGDNGYGDYVIMKVDASGKIADWRPTLESFSQDE